MLFSNDVEIAEAIALWGPVARTEWNRLANFEAYYRGVHRPPYEPETATREFRELVSRSVTNLTRLIVNTLTQRLIVDGFRPSSTSMENAPQWEWWQQNGLDARQKALYDEAAKSGYAGCMVLPGDPAPVMRPVSPREWWLGFEDYSDDWPFLALKQPEKRNPLDLSPAESQTWHVLDEMNRFVVRTTGDHTCEIQQVDEHGLGEVPIVPFRNGWNLTRYPDGEIEPAMAIQDRLNQTCFDLLVAQTYAASPQKYATGMVLPTDEQGNPLVDLRAFAKSLWATSDPDARFGSLPEANLKNIVEAIEQALRMYGLMTQTPPHYLLGDMVNLPLALDTVVPTPSGPTTISELKAGDQVLAPDGQAIDVIGKTPVFLGHDCYRLRFDDGAEVVADAQHRWVTSSFESPMAAPYKHGTRVSSVTTRQIAESLKTCLGTNNHWIPVAQPYDGPEADLPIDPYVLGVWLGDGDRINGVITSHTEDREELAEHLRACGENVTTKPYLDDAHPNCWHVRICVDRERCPRGHVRPRGTKHDTARCVACAAQLYRFQRYGEPMGPKVNQSFRERLKALGVWRHKHIPVAYFNGSLKQRLALIQGLMDTDGSTTPGGTVAFTCHDEFLAEGFARLVRSVGHKVNLRLTEGLTFDRSAKVPCWRMSWSATSPVFRLERKLARQRMSFGGGDGGSNRPLRHYIVACDPVPSVPVQCITVDSPDHLFLVTEHRITTGNSAEALLAADTTLAKKVQDRQVLFGEAWEQTFRMAGRAAGDEAAAVDQEAQVWWRDTEPRSIAQQVDALGKMATMLQVPPSALWERIPGATGADLELWRTEAARARLKALRDGPQDITGGGNSAQRFPGVPGGTPADRATA